MILLLCIMSFNIIYTPLYYIDVSFAQNTLSSVSGQFFEKLHDNLRRRSKSSKGEKT